MRRLWLRIPDGEMGEFGDYVDGGFERLCRLRGRAVGIKASPPPKEF